MRSLFLFSVIVMLATCSGDASARHRRRARVTPPRTPDAVVLQGSPTALAGENAVADEYHLERYKDYLAIKAAIDRGELVPIAPNDRMSIDDKLGEDDAEHAQYYQYGRPWVKAFLDDLARAPSMPAGSHYKLTSLVRSEVYQLRLRKHSVTAASGSTPARRSSHLTGSTLDITTKDMPEDLKAWMRVRLANMERAGLIQATEEKFGSLCFHIMVHPDYVQRALASPPGP